MGRGVWWLLAFSAAAAPWALGAARPLPQMGLALLVAAAALGWLAERQRHGSAVGWRESERWAARLWGAVALWALAQSVVPLPDPLAHPDWRAVLGAGEWGVIAAAPDAARRGGVWLLALGLAFWLGREIGRQRAAALMMHRLMGASVATAALYGLVMQAGGWSMVLWWEKEVYRDVLTGPFINRNAAACFFGFGVSLWAVLAMRGQTGSARWGAGAAMLACFAALLLTASRAGLGATLTASLIVVGLGRPRGWDVLIAGLALAGVSGLMLGIGPGEEIWRRMLSIAQGDAGFDRRAVFTAAGQAIMDRWAFGHGMGGFGDVIARWRSADTPWHWDRAHSVYLETMVELGVPAAGMLGLAVGAVGLTLLQTCLRCQRVDGPAPAAAVIGLAWLGQAALHGLVDFAPQTPALALWLALGLGIGAGRSWRADRSLAA